MEQIRRYLKGTVNEGLVLRPKYLDYTNMDVYVDLDFASGWGTEEGTNPDSVKSCTRFVVELMNCPVIWCSKLQLCVAMSTMEAEYNALSMALCAVIPLIYITKAVVNGLKMLNRHCVTFCTTVHEDKMGALRLVQLKPSRHTPRLKFYAIKLHWF